MKDRDENGGVYCMGNLFTVWETVWEIYLLYGKSVGEVRKEGFDVKLMHRWEIEVSRDQGDGNLSNVE